MVSLRPLDARLTTLVGAGLLETPMLFFNGPGLLLDLMPVGFGHVQVLGRSELGLFHVGLDPCVDTDHAVAERMRDQAFGQDRQQIGRLVA